MADPVERQRPRGAGVALAIRPDACALLARSDLATDENHVLWVLSTDGDPPKRHLHLPLLPLTRRGQRANGTVGWLVRWSFLVHGSSVGGEGLLPDCRLDLGSAGACRDEVLTARARGADGGVTSRLVAPRACLAELERHRCVTRGIHTGTFHAPSPSLVIRLCSRSRTSATGASSQPMGARGEGPRNMGLITQLRQAPDRRRFVDRRHDTGRIETPIFVGCRHCWERQSLESDRIEFNAGRAWCRCQRCGQWFLVRWEDAVIVGAPLDAQSPPVG